LIFLIGSIFLEKLLSNEYKPKIFTKEQSRIVAERFVINSFRFKRYEGKNLRLVNTDIINCTSCYRYTYRYESGLNDLSSTVVGYEIKITVIEGSIKTIEAFEIGANNIKKIIGQGLDEYGCIPSSGYEWCPSKMRCIRNWEENCPE
jgi:hypothetical protein